MQTATLAFVVEGGWLTEHCRALVREGRWRHALDTLDALHGMTRDVAEAILKGQSRLVGDSSEGISLAPEAEAVRAETEEHLRWAFGGMYYDSANGRHYRPQAIVHQYGPASEDYAEEQVGFKPGRRTSMRDVFAKRFYEKKVMFFADDRERDVVREVNVPLVKGTLEPRPTTPGDENAYRDRRPVIFGYVEDPPPWAERFKNDAQGALDDFLGGGGGLPVRNDRSSRDPAPVFRWDKPTPETEAADRFEDAVESMTRKMDAEADMVLGEYVEDSLGRANRMAAAGIPGYSVGDYINDRAAGDREAERGAPVPDTAFQYRGGYVTEDGKFYGCPYHAHDQLARRLLIHKYGVPESDIENPQRMIDGRNVVHVQDAKLMGGVQFYVKGRDYVSQRQLDTVWDYCTKWGVKMPDHLTVR
jgi:hypothetical protein